MNLNNYLTYEILLELMYLRKDLLFLGGGEQVEIYKLEKRIIEIEKLINR